MDMKTPQNQQTPNRIPHPHVAARVTKMSHWSLYEYHVI